MIQIEEMRIYILNTTRFYHEDFEEYPGAWFSCPVDFEEVRERLGVQNEEEIEIEDYELPFPLEGSTRLWEINALCRIVQELSLIHIWLFCALQEYVLPLPWEVPLPSRL